MKTLYRIYEFFFDRWKIEIVKRGNETWQLFMGSIPIPNSNYGRDYVDYKCKNKFDGSEKIVRKYLN